MSIYTRTIKNIIILLAMSQPVLAHEYKIGELQLIHPWSREMPDGAKVAVGYVEIVNHGSEADRLIAVSGEIAKRSEVHQMTIDDNGVMTMRPAGNIEIPAHGTVELKPAGYHIMFIDLKDARKKGEKFAGSLTFEKAGTVEVEFSIDGGHGHKGNHGE